MNVQATGVVRRWLMRLLLTCRTHFRQSVVCIWLALPAPGVIAAGISIEDDLFIGVWSPFSSRWETEAPVCVWGDVAGEMFRVTATGLASDVNFVLSNRIGDGIDYRVFWYANRRSSRREELSSGVPSRNAIIGEQLRDCAQGANARIRVRIRRRDIDRAVPGIYDDTLLVVLSPL